MDLDELGQTPVTVKFAGAKAIWTYFQELWNIWKTKGVPVGATKRITYLPSTHGLRITINSVAQTLVEENCGHDYSEEAGLKGDFGDESNSC